MDIAPTSTYGSTSPTNVPVAESNSTTLSMNDFFELLAAQLQNQNMLDPVDNTEFIAQMAQFSTLSQMQELAKAGQMTYSVSLIGKTVTVSSIDENGTSVIRTGKVDNVTYQSGVPYIGIAGNSYLVSNVLSVENS